MDSFAVDVDADADDRYAFTGFRSSHVHPEDVVDEAAPSDHVISDADDDGVRTPPGGASAGAQHSKNPKNLHFASSHRAQVGQSHVVSDVRHGSYVPHASRTSGHVIRDPYYSMHVRETELEKMKTVSVLRVC